MLIDNHQILEALQRIGSHPTAQTSLHEDLMQEALIHLWRVEQERPAQRPSWYLQSCRFRLQHCLAAGRSMDSGRHRFNREASSDDDEELTDLLEACDSANRTLDEASAREILAILSPV